LKVKLFKYPEFIIKITSTSLFKIRSAFTGHLIQNNKVLTPECGGQYDPAKDGQGRLLFQIAAIIQVSYLGLWEV
jgi:hypothetical protein